MNEEAINILTSIQDELDALLKDLEKISGLKSEFDDTLNEFRQSLVNIMFSSDDLI